ncbi:MAG: hypothetical protein KC466_12755 [Myxococcales bacterium]|nr:hypothetical protein [Myxococcales bacterium]
MNAIAPGATLYRWYDKVGNIHYGTYEQAPKGAILAGAPGVDTRKQLIADFYGPAGPPKPQIHVVVQKEVSSRAAGAGASPPSSRKPAKAPSAGEPPASVEEAPVVPDVQDAPGAGEVP